MISFEGEVPPPIVKELIRERFVGGVLLFAQNCPSIKKTAQLIEGLKKEAKGPPLCLAVDHEGGYVHRLPKPVTHFPPMRLLGKLYERIPSSGIPLEVGRVMGRELSAIGFDLDFAPVVDCDTNPLNPVIGDRSFSSNPEIVSMVSAHIIRGLQEEGIAACAKHFPGHGDTNEDSHKVLPRLPHNLKRLESMELIPFKSAIREKVASIMTAHVVYEGIDRDIPATFSVKIVRDLLKKELGFEGLVVSDSLAMGAVQNGWSLEVSAVKAFLAGCDLLILGKDPNEIPPLLDYFGKKVEEGEIPMERLEMGYRRVLEFKKKYCRNVGVQRPPLDCVGVEAHREILNQIKDLS